MKLRSKSVPPTKVEKPTKVVSRSEKRPRSDPSIDGKNCVQTNQERLHKNDENHMNKRINRSNKKTASNEKIEKNKNIIKNELASVSNTVSNNEKLVKEFSEQQQQPDQKRMQLRSKSAVSKNNRATTTSTEKSDRQRNQRTENRLACKIDLKRSSFTNGSVVLVKWPSYPYWPARVTNIFKKNVDVIFFGDNSRSAKVKVEQIYDFGKNTDYLLKTLKCRQWRSIYAKAVRETEIYVGIPSKASVINLIDN